jgi:hypothetical protein
MREVQVLQHDGNGDGATNHGGPACASMARSESQLDGKFLVLQKGARDIMSDSAETMPRQRKTENPHDGSSVLQIHFLDPGKEIERPIHKGRLQGKFIIAKGIRN